jgi:hypothetical protein
LLPPANRKPPDKLTVVEHARVRKAIPAGVDQTIASGLERPGIQAARIFEFC